MPKAQNPKQNNYLSFRFWITLKITSSPQAGEDGGEGGNRYIESPSPFPSPLRDCVIIHYLSP